MNRGLMRASKPMLPNPVTAPRTLRAPAGVNALAALSPDTGLPVTTISRFGSVWIYDVEGTGVQTGALQGLNAASIGNVYSQFTVNIYLDDTGAWQRINTTEYGTLNQMVGGTSTAAFTVYTAAPAANPIGNFKLQFQVDAATGQTIVSNNSNGNSVATLHVQLSDAGTATAPRVLAVDHISTGAIAAGFGLSVLYSLQSSAIPGREAAEIDVTWVSATDASRTGRLTLSAWDSVTAREVIRIEADGTVGRLSYFGATAVVQQANASQATINAVTDANAKAALQSVYNLLKNYNLAPATA